ncbi:MAG: hypothetical protein RL095_2572 [Verrucomicrobiota bacterium]|jgi:hypothetical protein
MSESLKTLCFAALAGGALAAAVLLNPSQGQAAAFSDLGQPFFAGFNDPTSASSLEVISFDEKSGQFKTFKVELKDGRWTLPSHYGYPADAKERLKTAASQVVGLVKNEIRSDRPGDFAELGVIDPADLDAKTISGRGIQFTLKDGRGSVLASYIFGKEVENRPGWRYVRVTGESKTYAVKTDAQVSTHFGDWVDTDLLKIGQGDLKAIELNDYSVDSGAIRSKGGYRLEKQDQSWKLAAGLSAPEGLELDGAAVDSLGQALSQLRLVSVRPKPAKLAAILKGEKGGLSPEEALDLQARGFYVTEQGLKSNEGEFTVATDKGVTYTLRFGAVFYGDPSDAGSTSALAKDKSQEGKPQGAANRYLFVNCAFNESLFPAPAVPEEPKKLAEGAKPEEKTAYDSAFSAWETAKNAKAIWERDVKEAKEKAEAQNRRFADWYYVIPGDAFESVRPKLEKLCKAKPPVTVPGALKLPSLPGAPAPDPAP